MAVSKEKKSEILQKFARKTRAGGRDTGSAEVQVALLTESINEMTVHFTTHKKDEHGKRGLVRAVNQRRKLLDYLKKHDVKRYESLTAALGLRK